MNALTSPLTIMRIKMMGLLRYLRVAAKRMKKARIRKVALVAAVIVIHMVVKDKIGRMIVM